MLYNIITQSHLLKSNYKIENDNFESYNNLLLLLIDMEQKVMYEFIFIYINVISLYKIHHENIIDVILLCHIFINTNKIDPS